METSEQSENQLEEIQEDVLIHGSLKEIGLFRWVFNNLLVLLAVGLILLALAAIGTTFAQADWSTRISGVAFIIVFLLIGAVGSKERRISPKS